MRAAAPAARRLTGAALAAALTGCIGAPSPLAPHLGGSVGVPHHGVVTGAVPLPKKGVGFVRLRDDGVHWGSPRLVSAIQRAAAEVAGARPGGPPLVVGDLSERFGGQTERHRSHRTGRDVDLLFYVTTPKGAPVTTPGFLKVGADGLAESEGGRLLRFDVDRNWLLVRTLIEIEDVQWLFVSRNVESLLVEHARALGESDQLVWRAETVLRQPGDSAPHDDHFHVRLACTVDEMVAGCEGGPRWPWQPEIEPLDISDAELMASLFEE
jgi:penicillin-insensitive murein endopeptidase